MRRDVVAIVRTSQVPEKPSEGFEQVTQPHGSERGTYWGTHIHSPRSLVSYLWRAMHLALLHTDRHGLSSGKAGV